jgi:hypothetical protein
VRLEVRLFVFGIAARVGEVGGRERVDVAAEQRRVPGTSTPTPFMMRAASEYSATESGPYCQPSGQSPPASTPSVVSACAMSLAHSSSATRRQSAVPSAPASPACAIEIVVAAIR